MFRKFQVNDIFKLVKQHHKDTNWTFMLESTILHQSSKEGFVLKYGAGVKFNPLFIVGKHSSN